MKPNAQASAPKASSLPSMDSGLSGSDLGNGMAT
jgi:hypothetical protein